MIRNLFGAIRFLNHIEYIGGVTEGQLIAILEILIIQLRGSQVIEGYFIKRFLW